MTVQREGPGVLNLKYFPAAVLYMYVYNMVHCTSTPLNDHELHYTRTSMR